MANATETPKTPLCFVIGPIGRDGSSERKHADLLLHAVIKQVLGAEEFGYQVKRADEDADPGMIGDRVISQILDAELVVADLTDLNPNAFYELGIRHSTLKPTIHVAKSGTLLPFDTLAHRTIFIDLTEWQSIERSRALLAASARTINSSGFQVSNPLTQANASAKMRESADPQDRVIAQLQRSISSLQQALPRPTPRRTGEQSAMYFEHSDLTHAIDVKLLNLMTDALEFYRNAGIDQEAITTLINNMIEDRIVKIEST